MTDNIESNNGVRLAADIGGTFTDIVAFDEKTGKLQFGKTLSTPKELVKGISEGVQKTKLRFSDANLFLHGSTIAINIMLERTGAKTALIITEGFRDIYEIGRVNRPDAYNLYFKKHTALVERALRFEITERMYAEGKIYKPLAEDQVIALAEIIKKQDIESVAVLFLHSYRNPIHEIRAKEILEQYCPNIFVSVSHELSQEYREFERCSTVVANSYIGPLVKDYLTGIETHIMESGFKGSFLVVQSTGGLYEATQAKTECVRMLESGPAAGLIGTNAMCKVLGIENAISFDMGGTTAKSGVIYQNKPLTTGGALIGGYERALPVQVSMMDIFEVGTGGGSIATIGDGGSLHVGPKSAGAIPGPVCYGLGGTRPTVTDANLLLGRLGPDQFLGGEMKLDIKRAKNAIAKQIANPLNMTVIEAAEGILRIAATTMSYAVKGVSTDRGLDAADFIMVAIGGAGPLHASEVAREIGINQIIVPVSPGHFSAFGMLFSDLRYDFVQTNPSRLKDVSFNEIENVFQRMEKSGKAAIKKTSIAVHNIVVTRAVDMRYVGQEHPVTVDLDMQYFAEQDRDGIKTEFDRIHKIRYGTSAPDENAEIVSLRSTVTGLTQKPPLEKYLATGHEIPDKANTGTRKIFFQAGNGPIDTRLYSRNALLAGNKVSGPAIIEEHASTTVLFPGDELEVDGFGNLLITVSKT